MTAGTGHLEALNVLGHELRRPLTVVRGAATLLLDAIDDLPPDSRAEMLGLIDRGVEDMADLVEDVLVAVHLEAGDLKLQPERVGVAGLVGGVLERRRAAGERPLVVDVAEGLAVEADRGQAERALRCLLANAWQHTPDASPVEVRAAADGGFVRLAVLDRGPGIPEQRREEAFGLFCKLDRREPGAGLGLYLARGVARAMEGDAGLAARPDGGLEAWVTLMSRG